MDGSDGDYVSVSINLKKSLLMQSLSNKQQSSMELLLMNSLLTQCFGSFTFNTSSCCCPNAEDECDNPPCSTIKTESSLPEPSCEENPVDDSKYPDNFTVEASVQSCPLPEVDSKCHFRNHVHSESQTSMDLRVRPDVSDKCLQDSSPYNWDTTESSINNLISNLTEPMTQDVNALSQNPPAAQDCPGDFLATHLMPDSSLPVSPDADTTQRVSQLMKKRRIRSAVPTTRPPIKFMKDDTGKHICPACYRTFSMSKDANRHYQACHENIRYSCRICGFLVNRKDNLKTHIRKKHGIDDLSAKFIVANTQPQPA